VSCPSAAVCYAGGSMRNGQVVLKSTDGGSTWTEFLDRGR
jgi:hypothetical protein